jgi:hypothetical protein
MQPVFVHLPEKNARDQKSRNDKKNIHAHKTSVQNGGERMEHQNGDYGNRTKAVDVGSIAVCSRHQADFSL